MEKRQVCRTRTSDFPTRIVEYENEMRVITMKILLADYLGESLTGRNLSLEARIDIEKTSVHWLPYKRIIYHERTDGSLEEECWERPRAIEEFPSGFWTREKLN